MRAGHLSAQELRRQTDIVEKNLLPFFGSTKLAAIRPSKINAYIEARTWEVADKETNVLKHFLASRDDTWQLITSNEARKVKPPQPTEGRTRHLEPAQLEKLLLACPPWLRPIVGLAVSTGMRRG